MNARTLKAFVVAVALSTCGTSPASAGGPDAMLKQIAGYREWKRITPKPMAIEFSSLAGA